MSAESNETDEVNENVNPPAEGGLGNDYHEGSNPTPGGDIDTSGSTLPPYEGRSTGADFPGDRSSSAGAGTHRAEGEGLTSPDPSSTPGGATASPADEQPASEMPEIEPDDPGVGPSHLAGTTRGEHVGDRDGQESGRHDTESDDSTGRPAGESTNRDQTSVDPHDGNTDRTTG